MNRTDRLVAILLEFQSRGTLRAEDLATQFEVSVRTIYRDLDALSEGGVPLIAMPGQGYKLPEGYFLPPLAFTATEAALLMLGGNVVKDRVDPELRQPADDAMRKLAAVLPPDRRMEVDRWRDEVLFSQSRAGDDPRLARLRVAIRERRVVRIVYHAFRRPAPEPREIEPISLVFFGERWHIHAYCRLRLGMRLFRLDRVDHFNVLAESFTLADRHRATERLDEWKAGSDEARVRFDAASERWVRERQPFTFVREEHDALGPVFVYAIREELGFVRWLLSWGSAAEVLGPASLRARVRAEAQAIARRHSATDITVSGALSHAAGV